MIRLFLSESDWKADVSGGSDVGKRWISLLEDLGSVIWSLLTVGGRSEARLWLCNTISGITSIAPHRKRDLFVSLLRARTRNEVLASQLFRMIFERRPQKVGLLLAKRSCVLEKFFDGHPTRILQWFSHFAVGGGMEPKKGAKALSQFAFVNRDICWEELEWKGKHGQSPAVVATKPHYLMDLDVLRTVENLIDNVPEFWSSDEFAESLKDGSILSIDTNFFLEFFVRLMYEEDSRDVWEVIDEFLMEESFSFLCNHLLITLQGQEFHNFLELLHKYLDPRIETGNPGYSSLWLECILSKNNGFECIDQLLLLNAVISRGRQLLRLAQDEESLEELEKIKVIVSQIGTFSSSIDSLAPMLNECFKMKAMEAIKFLGLQSWVLHYELSEKCPTPESWELLFFHNKISFRKSDKYVLVSPNGQSEGNVSEFDDGLSAKRKHRKKEKRKKNKRRKFDDMVSYDYEEPEFDSSNERLGFQAGAGSWLLSVDGFSASWASADLPEYLSKFCFSTWMKWLLTSVT
ncbi:hypothetical protein K2173_000607 [Erythroxylum novogranatense]|uniref:Uncharacterized protein n=1 Tax=Erythroxylum novogranatense TaxID=1862640 RepID=A0AAV8S809_9ROSI|nr:hypothetical protein K2173_000607 [Erythroxylum novogranatense]